MRAMRIASLIAGLGAATQACSDSPSRPLAPRAPTGLSVAPDSQARFYRYYGQKIALVEEGALVVVQAPGGDPAAIEATARAVGLGARVRSRLGASRDHWLMELDPGKAVQEAERAAATLRGHPGIAFAEPVYRVLNGGYRLFLLNRLVVRYADGATTRQIDSLASFFRLRLERPPRPDSAFFEYLYELPPGTDARALRIADAVGSSPLVAWADVDKLTDASSAAVPSDPFYTLQYYLKSSQLYNGTPVDINVEPAWDLTRGAGVEVAIIDDGVDLLHGNSGGGYAGDLIGPFAGAQFYDAVNGNGADCPGDPGAPFNNDTHGTAIAGIIAATHNNGQGVAGIAPDVTLNVIRWICSDYSPPATVASESEMANAINFAWQAGSAVLNNSWRWGPYSQQIATAFDQARTLGRGGKGAVVVVAAGNSYPQPLPFPANLPNLVTVGALSPSGPRAYYSQVGPEVDIVAPSGAATDVCVGAVVTTDRWGTPGCSDGPGGNVNYTTTFSGTSAAAPQVAAVAALILAREPSLTESQVRARLCSTATYWGPANEYGCGKVDAYKALGGATFTVTLAGPSSVRPNQMCYWSAGVGGGVPPYSYVWKVNGLQVGSDQGLFYTNSGSAFVVSVTVTDNFQPTPHSLTRTRNVSISAGAPNCVY